MRGLLLMMMLIGCKMANEPKLSLITKAALLNFPSASSIEFYNNRLYVIGDDARHLAILDKQYNLIDSVELFPGESLRIPKKIKTDLEASTIVMHQNKEQLLVAGSGSTPEREYLLLFPLDELKNYQQIHLHAFYSRLKKMGLKQINIEGLATLRNMLVFANRGNLSDPQNNLILAPLNLLDTLEMSKPEIIELDLNEDGLFKGVSGLAYIPSLDLLFFTASIEETSNAVDDGGIGHSYLGYVDGFSSKMNQTIVKPDELWNLSVMKTEFLNEKIESVAVESVGREFILHLVADNDNGTSTLFKLSFPNPL